MAGKTRDEDKRKERKGSAEASGCGTYENRAKVQAEMEGQQRDGGAAKPGRSADGEAPIFDEKVHGEVMGREADELSSLRARIDELAAENKELLDGMLRLKADFENYRKRMLKEQTRILETAAADLIGKLLPILDDLERAIENSKCDAGSEKLRQGVEMVFSHMHDILEKEGLEVVTPEGEPFNPECHEAMMVVETDECPEGTVVEVVRNGYRFKGLLLRPAMVKVSCPARKSEGSG